MVWTKVLRISSEVSKTFQNSKTCLLCQTWDYTTLVYSTHLGSRIDQFFPSLNRNETSLCFGYNNRDLYYLFPRTVFFKFSVCCQWISKSLYSRNTGRHFVKILMSCRPNSTLSWTLNSVWVDFVFSMLQQKEGEQQKFCECLEGVWKVTGQCLEGVWMVSRWYL